MTIQGSPFNAASPQTTPTYDGTGQATHPSVVHVPGGWGIGYEYWMAFTPYALGNDDLENPSILASHNGVDWVVPNGLINPLNRVVGATYNADTELVLHDDTLHCFWRYYDGVNGILKRRTSTDGVHWTATETCDTGDGHLWTTPTFVVIDDTWHAWTVRASSDAVGAPKEVAYLTATDPTGPWSAAVSCTFEGFPADRNPWHIDVARQGGIWRMVISDGISGTNGEQGKLVLASSLDGLAWAASGHVMGPGASWDLRIYRPTLIIAGATAQIWYGAEDSIVTEAGTWRIGYTEIPLRRFPDPPSA